MNSKPKGKEALELSMDSDEFDKMMRGALQVEPPKRKPKQRIHKRGGYQRKR